MTLKTQQLIIGAGPSGLTAALELARRGHKPVIIDNDSEPTPESRALAVHARTLDILEPAGVTELLIEAGNRINGMIFRSGGRELFELPFSDLPHRFNFILAIPQSETERILIDAVEKLGIDIGWQTEAQIIREDDKKLIVTADRAGTPVEFETDTLIGADGARSLTRKFTQQEFAGETEEEEFGLVDVELNDWPFPWDRAVATRNGNCITGFFPYGEGKGRFVANHPDILNRLPPEAKIKSVGWQSSFRISYRQVASYQQDNAFLVGDAAHIHSPAGGRGMNLGVEDAATLAWMIDQGDTSQYSAMRHPVGKKVLDFTKQQSRQLMKPNALTEFTQNWVAPILLKSGFIRRMAMVRLSGLDTPAPPWLKPMA